MTAETRVVESPAPSTEAAPKQPEQPQRITDFKQIVPLQLVVSTISLAAVIMSPLYFIGLWKLEYEFSSVYHMDFWTAWTAANLEPRYVVAINGLGLLVSVSLLTFVGIMLLTAAVVYIRRWRFGLQDAPQSRSLLVRLIERLPGLRQPHSIVPEIAVLLAVVAAIANGLVDRPVDRTPWLLALNAVAVVGLVAVYYLFVVSPIDLRTRRDLSLAGGAAYFLGMSLVYSWAGTQHPTFWTVLAGTLGTVVAARVVASLVQRRVFFDLGPLAFLFVGYVCALLPAYFWVNSGQFGRGAYDLATPFVEVCMSPPTKLNFVLGNMVSEDRGNVNLIPVKMRIPKQGPAFIQPGRDIMFINGREITRLYYLSHKVRSCTRNANGITKPLNK